MLKNVSMEDDIDWEYLVSKTELFSGDDINNVCRDASMMPLRRELSNKLELDNPEAMKEVQERLRKIPVSMRDFISALEQVKPTNSKDKLERYQKWMDEHGST
jgi:SpoVK/Ycf46/Vps4 family AAA+-type ATPase